MGSLSHISSGGGHLSPCIWDGRKEFRDICPILGETFNSAAEPFGVCRDIASALSRSVKFSALSPGNVKLVEDASSAEDVTEFWMSLDTPLGIMRAPIIQAVTCGS